MGPIFYPDQRSEKWDSYFLLMWERVRIFPLVGYYKMDKEDNAGIFPFMDFRFCISIKSIGIIKNCNVLCVEIFQNGVRVTENFKF